MNADRGPAPMTSLLTRLHSITDPRMERNREHALIDILALAVCATLGGANSWLSVTRFARARIDWFRGFLGLANGVPSHDTFTRVFGLLKPEQVETCFSGWLAEVGRRLGLAHIAIDGKAMRGSDAAGKGTAALHMVGAFATEAGLALGQTAVDEKSNEITAIPKLLRMLELSGSIVTIDAMGCQTEIAEEVLKQGGDYLLAVKDNQPTLAAEAAAAVEEAAGAGRAARGLTEELNRGRVEVRTCQVITDLSGVTCKGRWKGLAAIGRVTSERMVDGEVEREERYYVTSRSMAACEMLRLVRGHWGIENRLHWVLDVVFGEDHHQLREGHGAHNFTLLRRLALSLIRNAGVKEGIKGAREMAGWDTRYLERLIEKALNSSTI